MQSYIFQTLTFTSFCEVSQVVPTFQVLYGNFVFPPSFLYAFYMIRPLFSFV